MSAVSWESKKRTASFSLGCKTLKSAEIVQPGKKSGRFQGQNMQKELIIVGSALQPKSGETFLRIRVCSMNTFYSVLTIKQDFPLTQPSPQRAREC
jgi:hypothetical protein